MSKREDPLKGSWAYQEIWQEGYQQGLQQATQHPELAFLRWQRQRLERVVESYFPNIIEMAKKRGNAIDDPDVLEDLIFDLVRVEKEFRVQMEEEARKILSK